MTSPSRSAASPCGSGARPRVLPASLGVTACVLPACALSPVGDSRASCSRRGRGGAVPAVTVTGAPASACACSWLCSVTLPCIQSSCGSQPLHSVLEQIGPGFLVGFCSQEPRHAAASLCCVQTILCSASVTALAFPGGSLLPRPRCPLMNRGFSARCRAVCLWEALGTALSSCRCDWLWPLAQGELQQPKRGIRRPERCPTQLGNATEGSFSPWVQGWFIRREIYLCVPGVCLSIAEPPIVWVTRRNGCTEAALGPPRG